MEMVSDFIIDCVTGSEVAIFQLWPELPGSFLRTELTTYMYRTKDSFAGQRYYIQTRSRGAAVGGKPAQTYRSQFPMMPRCQDRRTESESPRKHAMQSFSSFQAEVVEEERKALPIRCSFSAPPSRRGICLIRS